MTTRQTHIILFALLLSGIATAKTQATTSGDNPILKLSNYMNENTYALAGATKFECGAQYTLCTSAKMGAGLRFSYNINNMLRLSIDGNYYLKAPNTYNTIGLDGEIKEHFFERLWDINPSLNIVYGSGKFHFYLIAGISLSYGHDNLKTALANQARSGAWNEEIVAIDGIYYYSGTNDYYEAVDTHKIYYKADSGKPESVYAIGVNLGCGIEYQLLRNIRLHLEQSTSLTLPFSQSAWTWKLGGQYCF